MLSLSRQNARRQSGPLPDAAPDGVHAAVTELERAIAQGEANAPPPYPHAERAATGRSKCAQFEGPIDKGAWRVAFEREIDAGAFTRKGTGYLHPACAGEHLQDLDLLPKPEANCRLEPQKLESLNGEMQAASAGIDN